MLTIDNKTEAVEALRGIITNIEPEQILSDEDDDYLILWLKIWLKTNESAIQIPPLDVIKKKIDSIIESNTITLEDREDLFQTLARLIDKT